MSLKQGVLAYEALVGSRSRKLRRMYNGSKLRGGDGIGLDQVEKQKKRWKDDDHIYISLLFYGEEPSDAWKKIARNQKQRVGHFTLQLIEELAQFYGCRTLKLLDAHTVKKPYVYYKKEDDDWDLATCDIPGHVLNTFQHKTGNLYEDRGYKRDDEGPRDLVSRTREVNKMSHVGKRKVCQDIGPENPIYKACQWDFPNSMYVPGHDIPQHVLHRDLVRGQVRGRKKGRGRERGRGTTTNRDMTARELYMNLYRTLQFDTTNKGVHGRKKDYQSQKKEYEGRYSSEICDMMHTMEQQLFQFKGSVIHRTKYLDGNLKPRTSQHYKGFVMDGWKDEDEDEDDEDEETIRFRFGPKNNATDIYVTRTFPVLQYPDFIDSKCDFKFYIKDDTGAWKQETGLVIEQFVPKTLTDFLQETCKLGADDALKVHAWFRKRGCNTPAMFAKRVTQVDLQSAGMLMFPAMEVFKLAKAWWETHGQAEDQEETAAVALRSYPQHIQNMIDEQTYTQFKTGEIQIDICSECRGEGMWRLEDSAGYMTGEEVCDECNGMGYYIIPMERKDAGQAQAQEEAAAVALRSYPQHIPMERKDAGQAQAQEEAAYMALRSYPQHVQNMIDEQTYTQFKTGEIQIDTCSECRGEGRWLLEDSAGYSTGEEVCDECNGMGYHIIPIRPGEVSISSGLLAA